MRSMIKRCAPVRFLVGASLVALAVPFLAGCGESKTKISGTVMYGGKPLTGGQITFQPTKGKALPVTVNFGEDGKFEATVPTGELQVGVDNRGVQASSGPIGVNPSGAAAGFADQGKRGPGGGGKEVGPKGEKVGGPPKGLGSIPDDIKEKMKQEGKEIPTVGGQKVPGTYVKINEKYYDPATSGIKKTIESGTKDIGNIDVD